MLPKLSWRALHYSKPDLKKFPGLQYGWEALNGPDYVSIVLNASNEVAVNMFLNNRINFNNIIEIIDSSLNNNTFTNPKNLGDILEIDSITRNFAKKVSENFYD